MYIVYIHVHVLIYGPKMYSQATTAGTTAIRLSNSMYYIKPITIRYKCTTHMHMYNACMYVHLKVHSLTRVSTHVPKAHIVKCTTESVIYSRRSSMYMYMYKWSLYMYTYMYVYVLCIIHVRNAHYSTIHNSH